MFTIGDSIRSSKTSVQTSSKLTPALRKLKNFLNDYSYIYRLIKIARQYFLEKVSQVQTLEYRNGNMTVTLVPDYHNKNKYQSQDFREGIELSKGYILKAKNLAENQGAKLVLIIFPSKEQVYSSEISGLLPVTNNLDFYHEVDLIKVFCKENSISCIDLLQTFVSNRKTQLFYNIDGHLNKEGNKLIADTIYKYLENENLIN